MLFRLEFFFFFLVNGPGGDFVRAVAILQQELSRKLTDKMGLCPTVTFLATRNASDHVSEQRAWRCLLFAWAWPFCLVVWLRFPTENEPEFPMSAV